MQYSFLQIRKFLLVKTELKVLFCCLRLTDMTTYFISRSRKLRPNALARIQLFALAPVHVVTSINWRRDEIQ